MKFSSYYLLLAGLLFAASCGPKKNMIYMEKDAYGEEAFPDARIWKVYGDEAELFDLEKIEAWRDVLNVLLVFVCHGLLPSTCQG